MTAEGSSRQLEWERRAGRPAALAAFGGGLLPLAGAITLVVSLQGAAEGDAGLLLAANDAPAGAIAGAVLTGIGVVLLALALGYLYRATRPRRPDAPGFPLTVLLAASVGLAIAVVVYEAIRLDTASEFAALPDGSEEAADDLVAASATDTVGLVQVGLRLAFGASVIVVAVNAMRAGLLGRFMGVLGIGLGVIYVVPLVQPPLIQLFWGVALGFLFLDRWPGGERGPAWDRVEAIPWPTTADRMRAQQAAAAGDAEPPRGEAADEASSGGAPITRPASRKRRRSQ